MNIEIRKTKEDGVIQITTLDERWYAKEDENKVLRFNPSITWIGHYSPMGIGLLKHYASKGWDEAEAIKNAAAERGSKEHRACEALLNGQSVSLGTGFKTESGEYEELTPEEYWGVMTFAAWWAEFTKEHQVTLVDTEKTVWVDAPKGESYGYAGTRDVKLIVDGRPTVIDLKTSKEIYLSHELQLSALKHADPDLPDIFVLQIGYKKNRAGWKLTPIEDKFPLFLSAKRFWADANPESKPKQKDYPPELSLVSASKSLPTQHGTTTIEPAASAPKPKLKSRKPAKGKKVGKQHK